MKERGKKRKESSNSCCCCCWMRGYLVFWPMAASLHRERSMAISGEPFSSSATEGECIQKANTEMASDHVRAAATSSTSASTSQVPLLLKLATRWLICHWLGSLEESRRALAAAAAVVQWVNSDCHLRERTFQCPFIHPFIHSSIQQQQQQICQQDRERLYN